MKKLSIIVPCYNVEQYIDRCVSSLVNQTLDDSAYEIILVDDASRDSTWEKICGWEKSYPELICAVHCDENGRQGKARNIGLEYARGEYIGYVDSDDWVEKDMFETLLEVADAGGYDAVTCKSIRDRGSDFDAVNGRGSGQIRTMCIDTEEKRRDFIVSNPMGYAVWDKIVKRSVISDNDIAFPEKLAYEDIFYGTLLHLYVENIADIDTVFYHYFVNPGSTVLVGGQGHHGDIMTVNRILLNELKTRGMWERYHDELELDLLFTWYLGTFKVIALRFEKPPYDMFIRLKNEINALMPDCTRNPYIDRCMQEFYKLLVSLLRCDVSQEDLNNVAECFKKL